MNQESIIYRKNDWAAERRRYELCESILDKIGELLSDDVTFSPCWYIVVVVRNRDDLKALMTLAPLWNKSVNDNTCIDYTAKVDGEKVVIRAMNEALPETCKLVEEEYEVPEEPAKAAVPAHTGKRMVLKCDHAKSVEPEPQPQLMEAL